MGAGTGQQEVITSLLRRFGTAPKYLKIAGEWQDHAMFRLLTDNTA
ncbi:hypothetical protein AB0C12_06870 [Actinoplanes sp. NPDC048967]